MKRALLLILSLFVSILISACGGGAGADSGGGGGGSSTSSNAANVALFNAPMTGTGVSGSYTLTTTRSTPGVTQNGVSVTNSILPSTQALFCSDSKVHAALDSSIGFMGTLKVTDCVFSGLAGRIDVMIDLGIGMGFTTAGSVNYSYRVTPPSPAKAITAFNLAGVAGSINESNKTIALTLPYGTNATSLVAMFSTTGAGVAVGSTPQISGSTANNFTGPVAYKVTAADGTSVSYTVNVTVALNSAKAITSFSIAGAVGVINEVNKTIAVTVPNGTNPSALVATFTTTGAQVTVGSTPQVSGVTPNNFSGYYPVTYYVRAADSTSQSYSVTVTVALSTNKAITSFSVLGIPGAIDETNKTIALVMPSGVNVSALAATFTTSGTNVSVNSMSQYSGYTTNNFSTPVTYRVTAQDASTADYIVSVSFGPSSTFTRIVGGASSSYAVKSDGSLWGWGGASIGVAYSQIPKLIGVGYQEISTALYSASYQSSYLALKSDGSLWAWGSNSYGQLGDGTTTSINAPKQIGTGYIKIASGNAHSLALKSDGSLWAWGRNNFGQLGDGTTISSRAPTKIGDGYTAIAASECYSLAMKSDGSIWEWGNARMCSYSYYTTYNVLVPTQIGTGFTNISVGSYNAAGIKSDGSLWVWGSGALGDGGTSGTNFSTPKQIGTGFSSVAVGHGFVVTLKTDASVWTWGINNQGQLGDGLTSQSLVPKQIDTGYATIAAGLNHAIAIKTNGGLWAWGSNSSGQLGDGTTVGKKVPTLIVP